MAYTFMGLICLIIALTLNRIPEENWTNPIYYSFYLATGCASLFFAIGFVLILFN